MCYSENFFFCLNKKEKEECKENEVPSYYWYYLKVVERGWNLKTVKKFIQNKVKKSFFSHEEMNFLVLGIIKEIRNMFIKYYDGKGVFQKLEKIFNKKIHVLFKSVLTERKRIEEKKRRKKIRRGKTK